MSDSIRLHPKHGLNPTMVICFWCHEKRGDIALLGAAYRDEAPRTMVVDYEPCDACRARMAEGITIIEATQTAGKTTPTGRYVVISEDAAQRMLQPESLVMSVLAHRKALMEPDVFQAMFGGVYIQSPSETPS